jgi:hypothetical protein
MMNERMMTIIARSFFTAASRVRFESSHVSTTSPSSAKRAEQAVLHGGRLVPVGELRLDRAAVAERRVALQLHEGLARHVDVPRVVLVVAGVVAADDLEADVRRLEPRLARVLREVGDDEVEFRAAAEPERLREARADEHAGQDAVLERVGAPFGLDLPLRAERRDRVEHAVHRHHAPFARPVDAEDEHRRLALVVVAAARIEAGREPDFAVPRRERGEGPSRVRRFARELRLREPEMLVQPVLAEVEREVGLDVPDVRHEPQPEPVHDRVDHDVRRHAERDEEQRDDRDGAGAQVAEGEGDDVHAGGPAYVGARARTGGRG